MDCVDVGAEQLSCKQQVVSSMLTVSPNFGEAL